MTAENLSAHPKPTKVVSALRNAALYLNRTFLGKEHVVRVMLAGLVAGEHTLLIGPPGTGKSALVRTLAQLVDARWFDYLLTRFTEPNEIFGPVDITAFRAGTYKRRTEGMLPEAEIAFLDEIFKANSAILNSLLSVLNERRYTSGGVTLQVPLLAGFGASNETPHDDDLQAVFDRFLLRVPVDSLESFHFGELMRRGTAREAQHGRLPPIASAADIRALQAEVVARLSVPDDFLQQYKNIVFQLRAEGISLSDRRAIKMLKVFVAHALLDGRDVPDTRDLDLLRYVWNTREQEALVVAIVKPVVETFEHENPAARRTIGVPDLGVMHREIEVIRNALVSGERITDVQLFAHLKALGNLKVALLSIDSKESREAVARVDQLLNHVFQSGKLD